jgi:hypothetical protein
MSHRQKHKHKSRHHNHAIKPERSFSLRVLLPIQMDITSPETHRSSPDDLGKSAPSKVFPTSA